MRIVHMFIIADLGGVDIVLVRIPWFFLKIELFEESVNLPEII
jgi:hypothetical protein